MNRRNFLNATMLGATAGVVRANAIGPPDAGRKIGAVAFDGFAIFDPRPVGAIAEAAFPGKGADVMTLWRARQFEYSWVRTLTASYVDFWQVTQEALAFACASLKLELGAANRNRLMQAHLQLKPWPDVMPVLQQLHTQGIRMAFLSNFTASMLDANIQGARLDDFFDARLSTDQVAAFKPDPRSYQMAVDHFGLPRDAIAFVAFGGWDAAGARRFGFPVYWTNRFGQPAEELGAVAQLTSADLAALPAFIAAR